MYDTSTKSRVINLCNHVVIMPRLAITVIMVFTLALIVATPANGEAYTAILQDENLRISLYYPPEVKINSCYNFRFEAQAFESLTIGEIRLKVKMYRNGVTETLHDSILVDDTAVGSGWTFSKNIVVCIPTPRRPDPFLEAEIYASYTLDSGDTKTLSTEWYMSTVRTKTYDELLSELDETKKKIKYLEGRVRDLEDDIEELEERLSNMSRSYNELLTDYKALQKSFQRLQDDYGSLQQKYIGLQDEYKNLSEEYRKLLIDYEKLRTLYEKLIDENKQLQSNYNSLREDYISLTKEYYSLQGVHQDLTERYNDLTSRYELNIETIGQLQSTINSLEKTIREKDEKINELNLIYSSTASENTLTKSILYAQTAAVVGVGAGIYIMSLRRRKAAQPSTGFSSQPLVPPPPTAPLKEEMKNSGNGRVQKILSGRRITLPRDALEKLNINEGGKVVVEVYDDYVKIMPVKGEIQENNNN